MEKRALEVILTEDGSHTLYWPELHETYHSTKGALVESQYVYLQQGYEKVLNPGGVLNVLEIGFGTGSNALLTLKAAQRIQQATFYHTLEPYPLDREIWSQLNYGHLLQQPEIWEQLHACSWNEIHALSTWFSLHKEHVRLEDVVLGHDRYDVVYFDGFAPRKQAELWGLENLSKLYQAMKTGGLMVTYTAQAQLRRTLKQAGFHVEMVKGPPGKKEMTVAYKR
jgi:tRNA U34 5-methylaminomethyl-2-thiouridine-forming methyltransferase MnmC